MGEHLNLDGRTQNIDGGTLTLDGGMRPSASPHNLSAAHSQMLIRIPSLYDVIETTNDIQSSGEGHKTFKFKVISKSKKSSTRLLSKVIRLLKLRVAKIKLIII